LFNSKLNGRKLGFHTPLKQFCESLFQLPQSYNPQSFDNFLFCSVAKLVLEFRKVEKSALLVDLLWNNAKNKRRNLHEHENICFILASTSYFFGLYLHSVCGIEAFSHSIPQTHCTKPSSTSRLFEVEKRI